MSRHLQSLNTLFDSPAEAQAASVPADAAKPQRSLGRVGKIQSCGAVCQMGGALFEDESEELLPQSLRNRPLADFHKVTSASSVSTLATEGSTRLRHASSCNSVCSLAGVSEEDEIEYQLTAAPVQEDASTQEPQLNGLRLSPKESRHSQVPKPVDLAAEFAKNDRAITTIMIRNIPNRYSQRELINELKALGLGGTFDFLYVPLDLGTMFNVGYAFVNFTSSQGAAKCMETLQNHRFRRHRQAGKVAAVSIAHIQGLDANLKHYEKSAVNTARLRQRRPVVMANICDSIADDIA